MFKENAKFTYTTNYMMHLESSTPGDLALIQKWRELKLNG